MTKEDALEVAKMAAFAGSQLKVIDNFTSERTSYPANKIDINRFIASVKDPRLQHAPAAYLNQYPQGFAPPPPEEYIQSVEPDKSIGSLPSTNPPLQQVDVSLPVAPPIGLHPIPSNEQPKPEKLKTITLQDSILTKSDIDSIKNSLKNINNSLKGIVEVLKKSNE